MNFKEFESFSKEFFSVLVFLDNEENKNEVVRLIGLWIISNIRMRTEIEKTLLKLFDLALDASDELNTVTNNK